MTLVLLYNKTLKDVLSPESMILLNFSFQNTVAYHAIMMIIIFTHVLRSREREIKEFGFVPTYTYYSSRVRSDLPFSLELVTRSGEYTKVIRQGKI